ncbi:MAG: MFS transporter [Armatimonadota bacterium]
MTDAPVSLKSISPRQWRSGIAAWLGWLFDGLDIHLYTVVAAAFLAEILHTDKSASEVKTYSAIIQAAFLTGWALGGAFFGFLGDRIGRSRSLGLTILTYAVFTGLSSFSTEWWHLLIFRFVAALGIGGEWAVGSALLSETWPKQWRGWIAAVLQTGVNLGVLLATLTTFLMASTPRWVFLVGIVPAFLVFWIRRHVPEPEEWHAARADDAAPKPAVADLFRGGVARTTWLVIGVCAFSLTGWWAFQFWNLQYLQGMPEVKALGSTQATRIASTAFAWTIGISILGNFAAGGLARRFGYRNAILIMLAGFFVAEFLTFRNALPFATLYWCLPVVGFFSGVFGLFTMYLPPLFPVLLRTTGAGFCYNIGRIVAAAGTVLFKLVSPVEDLRVSLLWVAACFVLAVPFAAFLPNLRDRAD